MPEAPEKNLALDIVRITEAAALSSARWLGRGNKEAGDGAAVDAMRNSFSTLHVDGIVVIGEGEKDHAPMLYNGEKVGMGDGPQLDVAVDPVEGTSLLAYGRPNAISTVAVAPRGSMFNPGPSYYMQKLVVAREARDVIDLDAPVDVNLHNVARALGKNVQDLVVFVLDKPRHKKLIEDIRSTGARIQLHTDGDVAGALMAVDPRSEVDVMMGTGGTPEGVLAACAIKGMGGQILARLDPQSYVEKEAINVTEKFLAYEKKLSELNAELTEAKVQLLKNQQRVAELTTLLHEHKIPLPEERAILEEKKEEREKKKKVAAHSCHDA